jgi:hypothetical protein
MNFQDRRDRAESPESVAMPKGLELPVVEAETRGIGWSSLPIPRDLLVSVKNC